MKKDNTIYIDEIIESINKIFEYTSSLKKPHELAEEHLILDAVLRRFLLIGEIAKRVTEEFRKKYPMIKWREIPGLRDIIVHDYEDIMVDRIWDIIRKDLKTTLKELKKIRK